MTERKPLDDMTKSKVTGWKWCCSKSLLDDTFLQRMCRWLFLFDYERENYYKIISIIYLWSKAVSDPSFLILTWPTWPWPRWTFLWLCQYTTTDYTHTWMITGAVYTCRRYCTLHDDYYYDGTYDALIFTYIWIFVMTWHTVTLKKIKV